MSDLSTTRLGDVIAGRETAIAADWAQRQLAATGVRAGQASEAEQREQCRRIVVAFLSALTADGDATNVLGPPWRDVRDLLAEVARTRARQGYSPSETAMFVLSLKEPLFDALEQTLADAPERRAGETRRISGLIDRLALHTTEVHQKGREEVIDRQQREMLELSTPVVQLWDGVLALPLIGTLDSARTQIVMETLLQEIVNKGAGLAIIDITGVPTVDTLVAQHLLKTIAAARLMGAECILSGIRPQIAQTVVHLGVDLSDVITKATLAGAFSVALERLGLRVERRPLAG